MVADLFKTIAIEEKECEVYRDEISNDDDFTKNQRILFEMNDKDGDNNVAPEELLKFMKDNGIKDVNIDDARMIVNEYDM